ncbi:MAG: archaellin/type IV pilin N-terminal domain-containing protein [Thermoplasmata archaeon]
MRYKGVSPVIATVLLVIITVVLSVTFYFFLARSFSLPSASQTTPLGLKATLVNRSDVKVEIVYAPLEARINGSTISVISATQGVPLSFNATLFNSSGQVCGNYSTNIGWSNVSATFYANGFYLLIKNNALIKEGDSVQISGIGFALSSCKILR